MARLIYSAITSLDGYVADAAGKFDWSAPDEDVHRFVNDQERPVGTYLYGRRMYDVMRYWQTAPTEGDIPEVALDYARIWQAAEKVVYSATLSEVSTPQTRLERTFEPAAIRALKERAERDISIGGPGLAGAALAAGLVDELHLFLNPVLVGGGTQALPDGVRIRLELLDEHRFANGVIHLHHAVREA
jgi:dihydrofolate reductase